MRLDKFLCSSGNGTRKEVKALIKDKVVYINDNLATSPSINIDENKDIIRINDQIIEYHHFYYLLLNKPEGYVSATKKEKNYPPVTDLVYEYNFAKLFPVGRLDVDSTGLLLMTNDGLLAHKLLSPKYHVDKVYQVELDFPLKEDLIVKFEKGIILDGELTLPAKLKIIDDFHAEVTLHEGKFHQVKRMFLHFGYKVISLHRSTFAFLNLDGINEGEFRLLTSKEIECLNELANKDN